jgi:hypothetical protein
LAVTAPPPPTRPLPGWLRLLAVPVTAGIAVLGLWVFAGLVAPNYDSSIGLGVAWFVVLYVGLRLLGKRSPSLKLPATVTFAVVGVVIGVWFAWTTFRDVEVNEQIAVGAPASAANDGPVVAEGTPPAEPEGTPPAAPLTGNIQLANGTFESLAHAGSGTAAIVELEDGTRVLTFDDLSTDNGPDLRVYLVAGAATSGSVGEFVDLGGLKGNQGDQQYKIPADVDVSQFTTVAIWCRAFSVGFARATLTSS